MGLHRRGSPAESVPLPSIQSAITDVTQPSPSTVVDSFIVHAQRRLLDIISIGSSPLAQRRHERSIILHLHGQRRSSGINTIIMHSQSRSSAISTPPSRTITGDRPRPSSRSSRPSPRSSDDARSPTASLSSQQSAGTKRSSGQSLQGRKGQFDRDLGKLHVQDQDLGSPRVLEVLFRSTQKMKVPLSPFLSGVIAVIGTASESDSPPLAQWCDTSLQPTRLLRSRAPRDSRALLLLRTIVLLANPKGVCVIIVASVNWGLMLCNTVSNMCVQPSRNRSLHTRRT